MKTTSYFVGISLNSKWFVDLFTDLQKYLEENNLENIIELQNILSLHITLYYLSNKISPKTRKEFFTDIDNMNKTYPKLKISPLGIKYFKKNNSFMIGYLDCTNKELICKLHTELASKCKQTEVLDNEFPYLPHITLFKVKDYIIHKYKDKIEAIIKKHIDSLSRMNVFSGFNLYCDNSKFHPEIQIIMTK